MSKSLYNYDGDSVPPLSIKSHSPQFWWSAFLHAHHDALNTAFFKGALEEPQIEIVDDPDSEAVASYLEGANGDPIILVNIGLLQEFAEEAGIENVEGLALDAMLHEMVHQLLGQLGLDTEGDDHDNPAFEAEAERLSEELELEPPEKQTDLDEDDDEADEDEDESHPLRTERGGFLSPNAHVAGARFPQRKSITKGYDLSGWPLSFREPGFYERLPMKAFSSHLKAAEKAALARFDTRSNSKRHFEQWQALMDEEHRDWLDFVRDARAAGDIGYDISTLKQYGERFPRNARHAYKAGLKPC